MVILVLNVICPHVKEVDDLSNEFPITPTIKHIINMDKFKEIANTKQLRKDIDEVLQRVKNLEFRYETANVIIKLQEGVMWLDMYLKYLGETDNYPESRNPDSQRIEPTADGLKL